MTQEQLMAVEIAKKAIDNFANKYINGKITIDFVNGIPKIIEELKKTAIKTK